MKEYRPINKEEIAILERQSCRCDNWADVMVHPRFNPKFVKSTSLSGKIYLPLFEKELTFPGGIAKKPGIYSAHLHNVKVGDNSCIENIHNYIANYNIGENCIIENVDRIVTDRISTFGNGTEVSVLNETGGREVLINDKLTAQFAYIMALYRHRKKLISKMKGLVENYSEKHSSNIGEIGDNVTIINTGLVQCVKIGSNTTIEGALLLKNGSINSNSHDPVYIGHGVYCKDFIISSGASIDSGTTIEKCFIGQSTILCRNYSAEHSLFFSNCRGQNGEASAIFAGPYTVSHHKSTLLIAGQFSFMNAGSGSNQSNHMYKLGPIHQGIMERGAKTTSDSFILWPARIGAFSLVMGRHVNNTDTSMLPFSYLIERENTTYLIPGVNLRSVGTIRDAQKWPERDRRKDIAKLDQINYNLLSPYTIEKMMQGRDLLKNLKDLSGETTDLYSYKSTKIKNSSLFKGIKYYEIAIQKFMGNSVIKRLEGLVFKNEQEIADRLMPDTEIGKGSWLDVSGLITPKSEIEKLLNMIESAQVTSLKEINNYLEALHANYYNLEWTWCYHKIEEVYGIDLANIKAIDIKNIVEKWREAVVGLDRMLYEDARKEFSLSSMTGFGADGDLDQCRLDFEEVRGVFENNKFVSAVLKHIDEKNALGDELLSRIKHLIY
ncbi:MAG: DUF4954 family protein [Bacteroidales bacterium]